MWCQMADGESSSSVPLDPQELVHATFQTLFPNGYHSLLPVRKHRVRNVGLSHVLLHSLARCACLRAQALPPAVLPLLANSEALGIATHFTKGHDNRTQAYLQHCWPGVGGWDPTSRPWGLGVGQWYGPPHDA